MTGVWPKNRFGYQFAVNVPNAARLKVLFRIALDCHEAACDVRFTETDDPTAINLLVIDDTIDGPGNQVALTQEPTPGLSPDAQLLMRLDRVDLPTLAEEIIIQEFLHEIGHFLGRDHSNEASVMNAILGKAQALTGYDVWELQDNYGLPDLISLAA